MEEIGMKKPKIVVDLLVVTDVCIEAFKARVRLLQSRGKGTSRKKDDCEVNTADRGDHGYRSKQSSDQKEKRPFRRPNDTEKWCEFTAPQGMI
jgi:hypothetical protein